MTRFEIIVRGESSDHDETVRGIRALLKILGRRYRLNAEIVRPINEKSDPGQGRSKESLPKDKGQSNDTTKRR